MYTCPILYIHVFYYKLIYKTQELIILFINFGSPNFIFARNIVYLYKVTNCLKRCCQCCQVILMKMEENSLLHKNKKTIAFVQKLSESMFSEL
jgi:hypothetical protein